jgi:tetratricopeptide (TPR) repeat protein
VRGLIAQAAAAISAGRYEAGLTVARSGVAEARKIDYLPVLAEALLWEGTANGRLGHGELARSALEEAAAAAAASHAQRVAVRAWIQLMHFVGIDGHSPVDGLRYDEYAEAVLKRMYGAAELDAERLSWLSAIYSEQKRFPEAQKASVEQLAKVEANLGPGHRLYAAALDGLAGVLSAQGRNRDALPSQEKACAALERDLGGAHPQVALCLNNLAALLANVGEHARAVPLKQRALEIFGALPGHPSQMAMIHRNLARSFLELGRLEEARGQIEAAASLGKSRADGIALLLLRGELLRREGRAEDAVGEHRRAVAQSQGDPPSARLSPLVELAKSELAAGHEGEAERAADQAIELAREVYTDASFRIAEPLRLKAEALLAAHHPDRAKPIAEQALKALESAQLDPVALARTQFCLARTLPPPERARAVELAAAARKNGATDPELLQRLDSHNF